MPYFLASMGLLGHEQIVSYGAFSLPCYDDDNGLVACCQSSPWFHHVLDMDLSTNSHFLMLSG